MVWLGSPCLGFKSLYERAGPELQGPELLHDPGNVLYNLSHEIPTAKARKLEHDRPAKTEGTPAYIILHPCSNLLKCTVGGPAIVAAWHQGLRRIVCFFGGSQSMMALELNPVGMSCGIPSCSCLSSLKAWHTLSYYLVSWARPVEIRSPPDHGVRLNDVPTRMIRSPSGKTYCWGLSREYNELFRQIRSQKPS